MLSGFYRGAGYTWIIWTLLVFITRQNEPVTDGASDHAVVVSAFTTITQS